MKIQKVELDSIQESDYGLEHWLTVSIQSGWKVDQLKQLVLTTDFTLTLRQLEWIIRRERKKELRAHIRRIRQLEGQTNAIKIKYVLVGVKKLWYNIKS